MIIAKTPFRMSFVGGGSDLPSYYRGNNGGAVISTTIDKYIFVTVNKSFDDKIRLKYSQVEEVDKPDELEHKRAGEILKLLHIDKSIEISSLADIPSKGTGLGSSSSFTVALLQALYAYKGKYASPETLAREACRVEIELLGEPIGKQDQYAAAYGGLNLIKFNPDDTVNVCPVICKKETIVGLQDSLLMFYTGITRSASGILKEQNGNFLQKTKQRNIMTEMVKSTITLKDELEKNNLDAFGRILHENWILKKEMASGVSNPKIDTWYTKAIKAGATGGKLLGAGGGGFLLFFVPKERQKEVKKSLKEIRNVDFSFDFQGSKIIFIHD